MDPTFQPDSPEDSGAAATPGEPAARPRADVRLEAALLDHFERAPFGLAALGPDRTILRANAALTEATGIPAAVLSGSPLRRILSTDAPIDLEDRIFEELDRAGRWLAELEIRTAIGDTGPMMVSITPVDAAEPVRYLLAVFELGQQRWIEAESSRRAAEIAAFGSIAVATGSSADSSVMLNAAARAIVERLEVDACWIHRREGRTQRLHLVAEAVTLNPSLQLSPRMYPNASNPAVLRAAGQREQVAESELLDRSIATVVHAPLLAADDVVGVISILSVEGEKLSARNSDLLRAVSYQVGTAIENARLVESIRVHQKELEEKNAQLELFVEELMKADRLKNEFLANTSHELRTPLNSIIGFINLVLEGLCENEEEQRELLNHAVLSGRHLLDLINDVLDLSRIEAGRLQLEMRDLELGPIVSEVEGTLAVQAYERQLSFDVLPVPAGLRVHADDARLRQVLMNVVGNAIKFTPRGGVIVSAESPEGSTCVVIRVEDTGIGIPNEVRDRLFRKFIQGDASTTRKYGGTGLGLVIVKELVEMMGGSVQLESDGEGRGTIVSILIPKARAGSPGPAPGGPSATAS